MAVKDWFTTPALNVSVGGNNIAENSPRASLNNAIRSVMAESKLKFDSFGVSMDDYGAVGDGSTDDYAAFNLFRAAVATIQAADPTAWVKLNLTPGKTYASRDNGWLYGLKQVIVNGNGAHFKNICTAGQSGWDFDHFPIVIGASAYEGAVTTMMAGKGITVNDTGHYLINTATRGGTTVTTTTAADAGNFTAGDWVLICSDIAYIGGQPPSMHFFQYSKVLTAVAGTGVITLDGSYVRHAYSATRDNTLLSGTFGSAARIFKCAPKWDTDLIIRDLIIDASANFPGFPAYAYGRNIKMENCRAPGLTLSVVDSARIENCRFEGTQHEPVDKLVARAEFINSDITGTGSGGDGSGGQVSYKGCYFSHNVRALRNVSYDHCTFGDTLQLNECNHFRATNCAGTGGPLYTESDVVCTVDGATITSTATTIVIPRAGITQSSTIANFLQKLTIGCRIDEVSDATVNAYRNGKFCIVTSITDSGANLVVGVNYSGGTSIANGTIFRQPCLLSYYGEGNFGTGFIANDVQNQSATGIPNGGLDVIRGNYRIFQIAPESGSGYDLATLPCAGMPKRIWARVHRPYTGVTHATLGLEVLGVQPTAAQYERIDLKTVGVREATRSAATAALGADTWAALPATYTGRYRLVINVAAAGAAAALSEATQLLPILELLIEFEDIAHSVPVAS